MTVPSVEHGGYGRPPDVKISDSTAVQVGSGNMINQYFAQVMREVVWPVRVGPVLPPADGFQHRQAESLWNAVRSDGQTASTHVLRGLGGVGKTQLAAGLADQMWRQHEVDLLVWITAQDRASIISGYAEAAAATGINTDDPEQAAGRMRDWLAATQKRWLVVLDDVSVPADLNGWWPPDNPFGLTVVTTRRRDAALAGQRRRVVDVGVFTRGEALAYLVRKFTASPNLGDDIDGVAEDLGFLPLALAQAAAFMLDGGIPCGQYRKRLADRRRQLKQVLPEPESLPDQHQPTVNLTWSLSIEAADMLPPVGLARPLLEACSVLDPNGIPYEILTTGAMCGWFSLSRNAGANNVATSELVGDAVAALHRLSLVDITSPTAESAQLRAPLIRVHALVQRAVREALLPERRDQVSTVAADALLQSWPTVDNEPAYIQTLYANTKSLANNYPDALWKPEVGGHLVLFRAGDSLGSLGRFRDAITHYLDLHHTALQRLGPDHPQTLAACGNLAQWRGEAGDPGGAVAAYTELLDDMLRVLGSDHPDALTVRANLAHSRGASGDPGGAVVAYTELLEDMIRVFAPHHPKTLIARSNLARWRGEVGDAGGAVIALTELLDDMFRVLGPDHPDTLVTRSNLARWRGEAGDPSGAVAAYTELLDDMLRVLGQDHPQTLSARSNLARWRGEAGDPSGAVAAYTELLDDMLRVLGSDHTDTLNIRSNLANLQGNTAGPASAATALTGLLVDMLRVFGPSHPGTLATRGNLARWRGEAGDPGGAAAAYAELLDDMLRVLGPNHPHIMATRDSLARWRGEAGNPADAAAALTGLLEDMLRLFGSDHPPTLSVRSNLAHFQGTAGDPAGAAVALTGLLDDMLRVLGPDHPNTLTIRGNLARWRGEAGNPAAAAAGYAELLDDMLQVLGPNHPHTMTTRDRLIRWSEEAAKATSQLDSGDVVGKP